MQAKLNRDKNADVKELLAKEEQSKADIEDLTGKLEEEKRKYDDHLNNKLDLEEKMKLATDSLADYNAMIEV